VHPEHVFRALDSARSGLVEEGNVGGGTGMMCGEFKGGIGTSSRLVKTPAGSFVVGVLVQANYGRREDLRIAGIPVGREIPDLMPKLPTIAPAADKRKDGSIIIVLGTNAPLLPHQLQRVLRRTSLGLGRMGSAAYNSSGDLFVAFGLPQPKINAAGLETWQALENDELDPLFLAAVHATEEAITNALVAAETMTGVNGATVYALPHERLRALLKKYHRGPSQPER
jgi:L-aminopeptidase/D-esterase-like protein